MSFLNLRKKKAEVAPAPQKEAAPKRIVVAAKPETRKTGAADARILLRPRVTEKASSAQSNGVYAFEVAPTATKREIAAAITGLYQVEPRKIAVVPITRKQTFVRGRKGAKGGGKKAYIYLKTGQKIDNL